MLVFPAAHMDLQRYLDMRCTEHVTEPMAKTVCLQMLAGLAYLHTEEVVHRDLKPSNVLIMIRCVGDFHVVLCDFGMARWLPSLSAGNATPGVQTEGFRAPEVVARWELDDGFCAPPMDMWSFGVIVLDMLVSIRLGGHRSLGEQMKRFVQLLGPCPEDVLYYRDWRDVLARCNIIAEDRGAELEEILDVVRAPIQDLIRGCLQWHVELRWSAERALSCEWLSPSSHRRSGEPSANAGSSRVGFVQPAQVKCEIGSIDIGDQLATDSGGGVAVLELPYPLPAQARGMGAFSERSRAGGRSYREAGGVCACSGNCYQPGHRRHKCQSNRLCVYGVADLQRVGRYCELCCCAVPSCLRARWKGELCYAHRSAVEKMPPSVVILRAGAHMLDSLWPCDLVHFVHVWPSICDDLALAVIVAWVKVPASRQHFLAQSQGSESRDAFLHAAFMSAFHADLEVDSIHVEQRKVLGKAGAMRTLGLAACGRKFGLVEAIGESGAMPPAQSRGWRRFRFKQPECVHLGASRRAYRVLRGSERLERLCQIGAAHGPIPPVTDGQSFQAAVDVVNKFLDQVSEILVSRLGKYTRRYLLRSIIIAHLAQSQGEVDWETVSLCMLKSAVADQKDDLEGVPGTWSSAELSDFCFGRSDWGIFVSMFSCLWREVFAKHNVDEINRMIQDEAFERVVTAYVRHFGFSPHVHTATRIYMGQEAMEETEEEEDVDDA